MPASQPYANQTQVKCKQNVCVCAKVTLSGVLGADTSKAGGAREDTLAASVRVDGERIEHLRKTRLGMSRKDAATVLGLSATALYMIERSSKRTRPATLKRIAAFLREDPENLASQGSTNGA